MKYWIFVLILLTALRLALAASLPLVPDEAYYWLWSQHLQAGYCDHPPMVAAWVAAGELIGGTSALGVRLLAPLASAVASLFIWRAAEDFFPGRGAGLTACCLSNATVLVGVSFLMTPDAPLLFFWTAAIAALGRWFVSGDDRWWLAVGVAAGCALLSKYTAILLIAAIGLWLLTTPEGRKALRRPLPWAGLAIAFALFAPNIVWNATHGWVSYLKQGSRLVEFDPSRALVYFADMILGQIGLATPLVFGLAAVGVWRLARTGDAKAKLLLWLTLLPTAVFVQHSMLDRVQGQWPAIIYPSAFIAAAALPAAMIARWRGPAMAVGFAMTILAYAQATLASFPFPAARDPTAILMAGWPEYARALAARSKAFVTQAGKIELAEIAFYAPPDVVVAGFDDRWSYFDWADASALAGTRGLIIFDGPNPPAQFGDSCARLDRKRKNDVAFVYQACDFTAPARGVLLPRPTRLVSPGLTDAAGF